MPTAMRNLFLLLPLMALAAACANKENLGKDLGSAGHSAEKTGIEYAPQMYHSIPPEPYSQTEYNRWFADGRNAQKPVAGTVARGQVMYYYPYPNTPEGYEKAGKELKNPVPVTVAHVEEGKRLYGLFCTHCHGANGQGDGKVGAKGGGKFAAVPAYTDPGRYDLPEGKIYHSIHHGKNLMGPHAAFMSPEERWKVVMFVQTLQKGATGATEGGAKADSTQPATAAPAASTPTPAAAPARSY